MDPFATKYTFNLKSAQPFESHHGATFPETTNQLHVAGSTNFDNMVLQYSQITQEDAWQDTKSD